METIGGNNRGNQIFNLNLCELMISLRDYTRSDIDRLVCLANNQNVSRYLVDTFPYPYTEKDARWWIETGSMENGSVTKTIEYRGEFVGSVGIRPQSGLKSHINDKGENE